jgi:threonine dehydrogenase-like Zn-dependent dehydrogenase
MRVAVIANPRRLRIEQAEPPEPGPGEARLRLEGCGICGSNLPVWQGRPWFKYPLLPGEPDHEGWGVVDAVGAGGDGIRTGQRVAFQSFNALADYDLARVGSLVPLPPQLDGQPFPGEPLGCAVNVMRRSDVQAGQTVAVVGCGFLGCLLVGLAGAAGARVTAISRRRSSLQMAGLMGAERMVIVSGEQDRDVARALAAARDGFDRVIEATGFQQPLALAGRLTRERGRLIIAGYHQDGLREVDMQLWNWRGLDIVNAHERDPASCVEGIRGAVEAVVKGTIDPSPLYTHGFSLEEAAKAFDCLAEGPDGFLKALVRM